MDREGAVPEVPFLPQIQDEVSAVWPRRARFYPRFRGQAGVIGGVLPRSPAMRKSLGSHTSRRVARRTAEPARPDGMLPEHGRGSSHP